MKKRSRAGGNPANARPSKALKLKRHTVPKVAAGGSPAMEQIADWLEKIGMSEYAERFAENDIDVEVLGELTDTDFDRLGVSIGHRRKLLKAVAAGLSRGSSVLRTGCPGKPASIPNGAARSPRPSQGGGADRCSNRARVPACAPICLGEQA